MKTKSIVMLGLILALLLATSGIKAAYAEGVEVPFKAYYLVSAVPTRVDPCPDQTGPMTWCLQQTFTPGGDTTASHMGLSQFYGQALAWPGPTIIQKGTGTLIAANGDTLTVYYEGTGTVINQGANIVVDGWYVVTGGTGRFLDVAGEGTYHVFVYNDFSQPNDLWFEGHLHK